MRLPAWMLPPATHTGGYCLVQCCQICPPVCSRRRMFTTPRYRIFLQQLTPSTSLSFLHDEPRLSQIYHPNYKEPPTLYGILVSPFPVSCAVTSHPHHPLFSRAIISPNSYPPSTQILPQPTQQQPGQNSRKPSSAPAIALLSPTSSPPSSSTTSATPSPPGSPPTHGTHRSKTSAWRCPTRTFSSPTYFQHLGLSSSSAPSRDT